jgi:hypothetical protein
LHAALRMEDSWAEGTDLNAQFAGQPSSSCVSDHTHTERTFTSVDLMDFESILIYFSEGEIEELLVAIDERRSRRLARDREVCLGSEEQLVYPLDGRGAGFQKLPTARATH